jgi:predicted DNA-binding protein (UPF0251 family)
MKNKVMMLLLLIAGKSLYASDSYTHSSSDAGSSVSFAEDDLGLLNVKDNQAAFEAQVKNFVQYAVDEGALEEGDFELMVTHLMKKTRTELLPMLQATKGHRHKKFNFEKELVEVLREQVAQMEASGRQAAESLEIQRKTLEYTLNGWKRKFVAAILGGAVSLAVNAIQSGFLIAIASDDSSDAQNCTN